MALNCPLGKPCPDGARPNKIAHLQRLVEPHLDGLSLVVVGHPPGGRGDGALEELEALVVVVVAQLHLHPLAPDGGEVLNLQERRVGPLLEDDPVSR